MQQEVHGEGLMLHQEVPRSPQAVISATVYYHYTFREQQYVPFATVLAVAASQKSLRL